MTAPPTAKLASLTNTAKEELDQVDSASALEEWRVQYLGRKGELPRLLRTIKDLPEDERRIIGKSANQLRQELDQSYRQKKLAFPDANMTSTRTGLPSEAQPASLAQLGHLHPITLTIRRLVEIFSSLDFLIVEGPEVEQTKYNFDKLNIDFHHPARAETDTFHIDDHDDLVLRTHVSPLQVRAVLEHDLRAPFKFMYFGRCYRSEKADATHESIFHQFEYVVVSSDVNISDIKGITQHVYSEFFGKPIDIRFRPSYFPFVEPGLEMDITCVFCDGQGCRICKHSGWIEMAGAGMVHPNVLTNMNVDASRFQGIAMGAAIDRLAMLRHGITDIRLFWSGQIDFLKQFS